MSTIINRLTLKTTICQVIPHGGGAKEDRASIVGFNFKQGLTSDDMCK